MSDKPTFWRRMRRSRLLLVMSALTAFAGPVYLYCAYPWILRRHMKLMTDMVSSTPDAGASEEILRSFANHYVTLAVFWFAPLLLVFLTFAYLGLRLFAKADHL